MANEVARRARRRAIRLDVRRWTRASRGLKRLRAFAKLRSPFSVVTLERNLERLQQMGGAEVGRE